MAALFRVASVGDLCEGVKTFRLVRFDRKPVTPFAPGAHVVITLKDGASGRQGTRAYSLTSHPDDRLGYEIAVAHSGRGNGFSALLHTAVAPGRVLTVSEPVQGFGLADHAAHHLLIAGGIGITPIWSMARALDAVGTPFDLFYSAKTQASMPFLQALQALPYGTCSFTTTKPEGRRLDIAGLLSAARPQSHVYGCGPAGMLHDIAEAAHTLGWGAGRVHVESFDGSACADDTAFDLLLARSGRRFSVPPGRSILDTLLASGVEVDYDCRHGACGRCTQQVLQGDPDHRDATYAGQVDQRDWIRICVSRARSPELVLDL